MFIKLTHSFHLAFFLSEDICLKETMSLADSLYNLQLIQEFCQEYLNQCCHFTLEDMLYAASSIKVKYITLFALSLLESLF
jgi:calmodulin-regulated spectrin-associated protein